MKARTEKIGLAIVLLLATALAGMYLSGFLALLFLGLDTDAAGLGTYRIYARAVDLPQVSPYAGRIKAAGYAGFGLPSLACLALLVLVAKPSRRSLHGDARFARGTDLARKGMFQATDTSLVVGRFDGRLVRLNGQQFMLLAAPTRSGKGVGIVIPNLLEYRGSAVVLDIKGENYEVTSGWRANQGQEVYRFNPFAEDLRTHRWNPLTYVSDDPAFRVSDLMSIAAILYPDGADEQKFWVSQARNAFMAFSLYLFDNLDDMVRSGFPAEHGRPTLGAVYRISSGDGSDLKAYLRALAAKPFLGPHTRNAFSNLLSQAAETFASILGTFKEPLNAWINPVLDAATSGDDFLLTDLRRKKMTVYICIQPNKLAESRLIVNLFFSQVINQNTRELPHTNPELGQQCLLLMDEFTSIGRVDIIASAIAYMAGYNLRLLPIVQSVAQLDATYGREVARTIVTNCALQVLYAPREQQDASDYSEMLGYTTMRRQNVTRGREFSRSESEERRALMLPQELKAMGDDREVFLFEGVPHPVMCDKIRYYRDRHFARRLLPAPDVPCIKIQEKSRSNPVSGAENFARNA